MIIVLSLKLLGICISQFDKIDKNNGILFLLLYLKEEYFYIYEKCFYTPTKYTSYKYRCRHPNNIEYNKEYNKEYNIETYH